MSNKLYIATVADTRPKVERPADALCELVDRRTRTGKSFLRTNGLHRQVIDIGPVHYWDGHWQDIDTRLEAYDSTTFENWKAAYLFRSFNEREGIGFQYKSRKGGFARLKLVKIGSQSVAYQQPEPHHCNLLYNGVALDTDLHFQLRGERCAAWTTLHSEHAPRSWEWEIIHRQPLGIALNTRGWDAAGNATEIKLNRTTEKIGVGIYRTRLQKEWAGYCLKRNTETRAFEKIDPVYPVVIDPDISEEIVADNDDGLGNTSGVWSSTVVRLGNISSTRWNPGFRFQGIGVANGYTVDVATLKIYQTGTAVSGIGGNGTIYGYDTDDSATWVSSSIVPTSVAKTSASATWPASNVNDDKSLSVTSIAQEIIDRGGWSSGNDMSIFAIDGSSAVNYSLFSDYPSSGKHGRLEIDYTAGGGFDAATMPHLILPPPTPLPINVVSF